MDNKKRIVANFRNLPPELQDAVRKRYPNGFTEHMLRIDKGQNDFFYAVVFETDQVNYLVRIDVKIDDQIEEEEDKEYYDDEIKGAEYIIDNEENEEGNSEN
jgi:hypothetical protein